MLKYNAHGQPEMSEISGSYIRYEQKPYGRGCGIIAYTFLFALIALVAYVIISHPEILQKIMG